MNRYYILDAITQEPVPESNVLIWARWFEERSDQRRVALTKVGNFEVSTVFLGINHNFSGKGPPLLYETMVFQIESSDDLQCRRYSTRIEALEGHKNMVKSLEDSDLEDTHNAI